MTGEADIDPVVADAIAIIDEQRCIGCALCIVACPVDAIVGAAKLMHTVIAAHCTGCRLCVPPCPVNCIEIREIEPRQKPLRLAVEADAKRRFAARNLRLAREAGEKALKRERDRADRRKRETVARAIERARQRLQSR